MQFSPLIVRQRWLHCKNGSNLLKREQPTLPLAQIPPSNSTTWLPSRLFSSEGNICPLYCLIIDRFWCPTRHHEAR